MLTYAAGITLERELRQFLLTRRLERGVALVPVRTLLALLVQTCKY
jgi:hypothetical protein